MNQKTFKNTAANKSVLPPDDGPCQMAPFSDDRWEMDRQEIIRRKEIHRNLVYDNLKSFQKHATYQGAIFTPEEPKFPAEAVAKDQPKMEKEQESKMNFTDQLKFELPSKPKNPFDFENPGPPNLFPLLKFPEKRPTREELDRSIHRSFIPIMGTNSPPENPEQELKPHNIYGYKDIKNDRVVHYGATVPFWEFK